MEKISSRAIAQIKTLYKANEADLVKVNRLNEKIAALTAERDDIMEGINMVEARVKSITKKYSGVEYTSSDLIETVFTPVLNENGTQKVDDKGYPMKKKSYVCKYGEDFFPTVDEVSEGALVKETVESSEDIILHQYTEPYND